MGLTRADAERCGIGSLYPGAGPVKATAPAADAMNKLERRYADHLGGLVLSGAIRSWSYQPIKLRLADSTFYTPDFLVILPDGTIELHETKGWMRDDAAVKLKVAAEQHPFPFVLVRWVDKAWVIERIEAKRR